MARALHAAELVPEPIGLAHGFLVERWCDDARPLKADDKPIREIADYLGARARLFPARDTDGASIELLHEMIVRNISLALGAEAAQSFAAQSPALALLASQLRRVRTDNKLDPHEWVRTAGGRLLKTDALDHHAGHDLIGCQDLAWDVAGAICEFKLGPTQADELIARVEQASGNAIHREVIGFCRVAYAAFRRGQAAFGGSGDGADAVRLAEAAARYDAELQHLLACKWDATRQERPVG
jgi:hypothetical protein